MIIGVLAVALGVVVASAVLVGNLRSVVGNPLPAATASGTEDSSPSRYAHFDGYALGHT